MLALYGEHEAMQKITSNSILRKILMNNDNELSFLSYGVLIGISYAVGLIINWFRDMAQFSCFYNKTPCEKFKKWVYKNTEDYRGELDEFYKNNAHSSEKKDEFFERMIVMFQIAGNLAITAILCSITWIVSVEFSSVKPYIPYALLIFLVVALICFSLFKFKEHIRALKEWNAKSGSNKGKER